jgi:hypothetical protein
MRSFKISEISAVDRPAQEGAQALILKRGGSWREVDGVERAERELAALEADVEKREDGPYGTMRRLEDLMDGLADLCKRDGETTEQSMSRLVAERHPLMMSMAGNRDAAYELAAAGMNPSSGPALKRGSPDGAMARAERELDALAKRRTDGTGETHAAAYAAVLDTPEGQRLYAEYSDAMDAASRRS